jgi:VanZ family protein
MHLQQRILILLSCPLILIVALTVPDEMLAPYLQLDKLGHFLSFFILAWLVTTLLKLPFRVTLPCLIIYGGLTELTQSYLGFRNGELTDFIADSLGVLAFCLSAAFVKVLQKDRIFEE